MAQDYDIVMKHLLEEYSPEIVRFALNDPHLKVLRKFDTVQPAVHVRYSDCTLKVRTGSHEAILHIEVQVGDSTSKPMPLRVVEYNSFLVAAHALPVYTIVIYLRPTAGRNDPGFYAYAWNDFLFSIKYKVIRLAEAEGQQILESPAIGLLPFTPLMKPPTGMDAVQWMKKCIDATTATPVDRQTRGTLMYALGLFGGLAHDLTLLTQLLSRDIMQESPFYHHHFADVKQQGLEQGLVRGIERGTEQGQKTRAIEDILEVLEVRFPEEDTQAPKAALETIEDLQHLTQLHRAALLAENLDDFSRHLRP